MSVIAEELKDGRVGRFPVWLIGVGLAAVFLLILFIRNRFRNSEGEAIESDYANQPDDTVDGIPTQSFTDEISGNFPSNVSLAPRPERPVTNAQWLILAFDYLVGLGKNPTLVRHALQKFLNGSSLTAEEQALVDTATSNTHLSLPPEGAQMTPPPTQTPPPGTNPPPPPSQAPTHVTAPLGRNLYTWVDEINQQYALGLSFTRLFGTFKNDPTAMNPTARNYMAWDDSQPNKIPTFVKTPPPIRIR